MAINEKEKSLGSGKRFGVRYGRSLKQTFAQIEKEHRKLHVCPYCAYTQVKRLSAGIWQCKKCGHKVAGRAFTLSKDISIKEAVATGDDIFGSKKKGKVVSEEDAS